MMSNEFEKAFGEYLDSPDYDQAEERLFALARQAFTAGWRAALRAGAVPTEEDTP